MASHDSNNIFAYEFALLNQGEDTYVLVEMGLKFFHGVILRFEETWMCK